MSADLTLFEYELRPARGKPEGALILLHGRGTDQFDLLPLLDALDPDRRLAGVTPRAPLELSPGGFHWYVSREVGHPDHDTFHATYDDLVLWLDALGEALDVPWSQTILGGFSMGAVMSYALGLSARRPAPAAVLALSGFIPTVAGWEPELTRQGLAVAIGHGTHDPVIDVAFARDARQRLLAAGLPVLYRESPMLHAIDPIFVHVLQNWVSDAIPSLRGGSRGVA